MDLSVNGLKCEEVSLKSECSMTCLHVATADDTEEVMAGRPRRNSITTFTLNATTTFDTVDGRIQCEQLVALQVKMRNRDYFLCPKKPKASQKVLKLRPRKIKACKVLDKKNSEIQVKRHKYWFKFKIAGNGDNVFESLAYKSFYISVEGDKVLMRKCSEGIPFGRNYHIDVLPPIKNKYNIEVRSTVETFRTCGEIPSIEICEMNVEVEVDEAHLAPCVEGCLRPGCNQMSSATGDPDPQTWEKSEDDVDVEKGGFQSVCTGISADEGTPISTSVSWNTMNVFSERQSDDQAEEKPEEVPSTADAGDRKGQVNDKNVNEVRGDDFQNGHATMVLTSSGEVSDVDSKAENNHPGMYDNSDNRTDRYNTANGSTRRNSTTRTSANSNGKTNSNGPVPVENQTRQANRRSILVDLFSCVSSR